MLGIDIVDLKDPLIKDRDKRMLRLIQHGEDRLLEHQNLYWLLWSAKEAVFKSQRKDEYFKPKTIQISLKRSSNSSFSFQSLAFDLEGHFEITEHYILAVCAQRIKSVAFEIINDRSTVTSRDIRNSIVAFFGQHQRKVSVKSDHLGLPYLAPTGDIISLSHHNHLGAFVYPKHLVDVKRN
ncbi:MAG: 4'-phosphopantetheinyl transferase superfamily protein [Bacteroidota bacterium]